MEGIDRSLEVATLVVAHRDDEDAQGILVEMAAQVELGNAASHLQVLLDADSQADAALWTVDVCESTGRREDVRLFGHLSQMPKLRLFRYVGLCTRSGDHAVASELDVRMERIRDAIDGLLGETFPRRQVRLGIVGWADDQIHPRFFSPTADANLVAIPLDRLHDRSVAQPVERAASATFHVHGAVEAISACGLWRTMDGAPVERIGPTPVSGEVRVRFMQSRMRLLRTPPIPLAEILSEERDLPAPDGFVPVTDVRERLEKVDGIVLPGELRYQPSSPPPVEREQMSAKDLALLIGREILVAFGDVGRLIWRVAGGEVAALTRRALQETVGRDSQIRVLTAADEALDERLRATGTEEQRAVDVRIARILASSDVEGRVDPIPGEIWASLVGVTLGMVDADPAAAEYRAAIFGDGERVLTSRAGLLGGLGRLPEGVAVLAGAEPRAARPAAEAGEEGAGPESGPTPARKSPEIAVDRREVITALVSSLERDVEILGQFQERWDAVIAALRTKDAAFARAFGRGKPFDYLSGAGTSSPGILTLRIDGRLSPKTAEALKNEVGSRALREVLSSSEFELPRVEIVAFAAGQERTWERRVHVDQVAAVTGLPAGALIRPLEVILHGTNKLTNVADLRRAMTEPRKEGTSGLLSALAVVDAAVDGKFLGAGAVPVTELLPAAKESLSRRTASRGESDRQAEVDGSDVLDGGAIDLSVLDGPPAELASVLPTDGLLVRIQSALVQQRVAATRDCRRLIERLRADRDALEPLRVQPVVPIGAAIGGVLLFLRLGLSDRSIQFLQGRDWSIAQLDFWFLMSTLVILILALFLSDVGNGMGGQQRAMLLGAGSIFVLVISVVWFDSIRGLVAGQLRTSLAFATVLAIVTVAFVLLAGIQSRRSGDPLRIQGSRVLGGLVLIYAIVGLIVNQSAPGSWRQQQSEDFAARLDVAILVLGLSLVGIAITVVTVIRLRESRQFSGRAELDAWALRALESAIITRDRLIAAERQWALTSAALAQVLRRPLGNIPGDATDADALGGEHALKSASVRLALNDDGKADLEARVRRMLIRPAWIRDRYESLVRDFQERLVRQGAVPAADAGERRPEGDRAVPAVSEVLTGEGATERLAFARQVQVAATEPPDPDDLERVDIVELFQPVLAAADVQRLVGFDGKADTVREYFGQVLPEVDAKIPAGVVQTALAANDEARSMRSFIWWPRRMLGAATVVDDERTEVFETELFRRGLIGGAGLVAVRVDVSADFAYSELSGAVPEFETASIVAEDGPDVMDEIDL